MLRSQSVKILSLLSLLILSFLLVSTVLRPIPILPESDLLSHSGRVVSIVETTQADIVFRLDDGRAFYVNRGTERGLTASALEDQLVGKELTFKYPDYRTYWGDASLKHVSVIRYKDELIFTESPE